MDAEFENVGASLGVPFYRTFWRVTVPIALPSIVAISMYFFLNAMVTLSAVVFIVAPGTELAAVAVLLMDDAGDTAQAAAMSVLIIAVGLMVRLVFSGVMRGGWRGPPGRDCHRGRDGSGRADGDRVAEVIAPSPYPSPCQGEGGVRVISENGRETRDRLFQGRGHRRRRRGGQHRLPLGPAGVAPRRRPRQGRADLRLHVP